MPRDLIPFRAGVGYSQRTAVATPDPAFAAMPLLKTLAETLAVAIPFRNACREWEHRGNRWGVPRLFFASEIGNGERSATPPRFIGDSVASIVARRNLESAAAWARLTDLIDDAFTACASRVEVRRVARAIPNLRGRLMELERDHRACRDMAALLRVADDLAITVLHPAARTGFRVHLQGITDLAQFHVLLADIVTGSPTRGFLPGIRPDARLVEACIDQPVDPEANIATARFQMYSHRAMQPDGTLPTGFGGVEFWHWGHESPCRIAQVAGERVLLIGEAAYPRQWTVSRRFSALRGEVELLRVLPEAEVEAWLSRIAGTQPSTIERRKAA